MGDFKEFLQQVVTGSPKADIDVSDENGAVLKLGLLNGKYVSAFGQASYRKIKDLALRDDDILLLGYPKTGCHWTWEILSMIVNGKAEISENGKMECFMEFSTTQIMDNVKGRRILNSHVLYEDLPKQMREKKTKVILTFRNPKDTVVSFYHHHTSLRGDWKYTGQFKSYFPMFMNGQVDNDSFFDCYKQWDEAIKNNPDQPFLVLSYEDMKEDLPREIRRMSEFIDVPLTDQQVTDIAKATGFDTMKDVYQKTGKYSGMFIRKGQVGDWKNWLTVAQSEIVDEAVREKLAGTIFHSPRYTI